METYRYEYLDHGSEWKQEDLEMIWISGGGEPDYENDPVIREEEVLYSIFQDKKKYCAAAEYVLNCYYVIEKKLSSQLDLINHSSLGDSGWDAFLFLWLGLYIGIMYSEYSVMKHLRGKQLNIYTFVPKKRVIANDYYSLYNLPLFAEQMHADIINWITGRKDTILQQEFELYNNKIGVSSCAIQPKSYRFTKLLRRKEVRIAIIGIYGRITTNILWDILSHGEILRYDYNIEKDIDIKSIDIDKRGAIRGSYDDLFVDCIYNLLGRHIPTIYIEGFSEIQNIYNCINVEIPRILITSNWIFTPIGSLFAAEVKRRGGKVYISQHGGSFCTEKYKGYWYMDYADKFYTWGTCVPSYNYKQWSFQPMPAVKTLSYRKYRPIRGRIMMAGYYNGGVYCQFDNYIEVIPPRIYYRYENEFLRNLSSEKLNRTRFREKKGNTATILRRGNELRSGFPELKYDTEVNFYDSLYKTELFVVCTLNTSFLEAINLNVPSILILGEDTIVLESGALEIIKKMEDESIVFRNPTDAAMFVNDQDDIWDWWKEPQRQKVLNEFRDMFSMRSRFGRIKWIKTIMNENRTIR